MATQNNNLHSLSYPFDSREKNESSKTTLLRRCFSKFLVFLSGIKKTMWEPSLLGCSNLNAWLHDPNIMPSSITYVLWESRRQVKQYWTCQNWHQASTRRHLHQMLLSMASIEFLPCFLMDWCWWLTISITNSERECEERQTSLTCLCGLCVLVQYLWCRLNTQQVSSTFYLTISSSPLDVWCSSVLTLRLGSFMW